MFAAKYTHIIQSKTQCKSYQRNDIADNFITTFDILGVDAPPTHACQPIGDPAKKRTRAPAFRLADLVRYARGGTTVYGDAPELYAVYGNAPLPIIDGVRGGVVPVRMRKNQF